MAASRRDWLASVLGVTVFLVGVGLVVWVFSQAFDLFTKAPQLNLGIEPGRPIDFGVVGINFARLLIRILVLVLMAGIGSALANRGARMYAAGRHGPPVAVPDPSQEPKGDDGPAST